MSVLSLQRVDDGLKPLLRHLVACYAEALYTYAGRPVAGRAEVAGGTEQEREWW